MAKSLSPPDCFIALQGRRIITRVRILWGLYKREVEVVEELGDEDALLIGQIWFNHHYPVINVNPDSIRTECRKLNMELPDERDENVDNMLVQIGKQLYYKNFIELDKPHNLQQNDVIIQCDNQNVEETSA